MNIEIDGDGVHFSEVDMDNIPTDRIQEALGAIEKRFKTKAQAWQGNNDRKTIDVPLDPEIPEEKADAAYRLQERLYLKLNKMTKQQLGEEIERMMANAKEI